MKGFMLRIWAMLAIHWLKGDWIPEKKDIIDTSSFILRAERKEVFDAKTGIKKLEHTFTIHRHVPPETVGPKPMWIYDKYKVKPDCSYELLQSGKYPDGWNR